MSKFPCPSSKVGVRLSAIPCPSFTVQGAFPTFHYTSSLAKVSLTCTNAKGMLRDYGVRGKSIDTRVANSRVSCALRCGASTERTHRGADRPPTIARRPQNCTCCLERSSRASVVANPLCSKTSTRCSKSSHGGARRVKIRRLSTPPRTNSAPAHRTMKLCVYTRKYIPRLPRNADRQCGAHAGEQARWR